MNIALYCLTVVDSILAKNSYLSSLQTLTTFETLGNVWSCYEQPQWRQQRIRHPRFGLFQTSWLSFHLNQLVKSVLANFLELNSKGVYLIFGKENRYPDCMLTSSISRGSRATKTTYTVHKRLMHVKSCRVLLI